ncbi:MAG: hypothetical protein H6712_08240 [Myxococcales bacterium]|nr:hypothetical protein [Myxococcales bacterium]MCB9713827.1 hypothetical protein [Myxococcales bacterium]
MRRRGQRVGRARGPRALLGLGLLGLAASACGTSIVRLTRRGAYEEAVAAAHERKVPPRGKAARSYAEALRQLGRTDEARAALLQDYRHGGDLRSLIALADLERELGLDGIAASHYGRVVDLSRDALQGRQDVCALLRRRAKVWAAEGAGLAAEQDLRRVESACGQPTEVAAVAELEQLRAQVDAAAQAQVDARVERATCGDGCDETRAVAHGLRDAIDRARAEGPAALRRAAARLRVELPPQDVVAILSADLRGEAGDAIITDDEVRAMVGEQHWPALAPAAMSQPSELAAYLQLRLAAVMPDVPVTQRSRTGPGESDVWLATVVETAGDHGWRVLAWTGDVTGAELALGEVWRPRRKVSGEAPEGAAEPEPSLADAGASEPAAPGPVAGIEPPAHWTARVEPTTQSLPALLLEGRLRHVAGQSERSLEILRYVAARAVAADLPEVDARVAREAAWHLAHGRPWHALAVAEPVPRPQTERVAAAAATALRLTQAFCGGPCNDDRDRGLVELTLGEAWVAEQEGRLLERSRARTRPASALDTCPSLGELLASDAEGRLAEVLREARAGETGPGHARRLREAIEADLGLGCAGRYVLPLLREGGQVAAADALAESLSHDATLEAAGALTVHAELAMIGQRPRQADLLATAAGAASDDPAVTWRTLARQAHATGQRELALRSLREALLHTPGLDDPSLHRALVLASLAGIDEGWSLRETAAGRAEPASHVRDLVERAEPEARWAIREELGRALAAQPWMDADARVRLEPALWPEPALADAHRVARGWLGLATGSPPPLRARDVGPLAPAELELLIAMRKLDALPDATVAFVEPEALQGVRLTLAIHGRQWVPRWRSAIGLAVYGDPGLRARALRQLLVMAEDEPRRALVELMLEDPAVIEPGVDAERYAEAPLVASPEDRLALAFGLPFDELGL